MRKKNPKTEALEVWAKAVKQGGKCQWCGRAGTKYLNAAHIYSRRFLHTRFLPLNGIALCPGCHRKAHDCPLSFAELIKEHLGLKRYWELVRTFHGGLK